MEDSSAGSRQTQPKQMWQSDNKEIMQWLLMVSKKAMSKASRLKKKERKREEERGKCIDSIVEGENWSYFPKNVLLEKT